VHRGKDYIEVGSEWFDRRVERMLKSMGRDLRALARRAAQYKGG
jgi:hypothetical protein